MDLSVRTLFTVYKVLHLFVDRSSATLMFHIWRLDTVPVSGVDAGGGVDDGVRVGVVFTTFTFHNRIRRDADNSGRLIRILSTDSWDSPEALSSGLKVTESSSSTGDTHTTVTLLTLICEDSSSSTFSSAVDCDSSNVLGSSSQLTHDLTVVLVLFINILLFFFNVDAEIISQSLSDTQIVIRSGSQIVIRYFDWRMTVWRLTTDDWRFGRSRLNGEVRRSCLKIEKCDIQINLN